MAADKRGRKRRIPDVAMPPPVAAYFHDYLVALADRLEEAESQPETTAGAVEQLVMLERLLVDVEDVRAMLTAWTVEDEMGEAPIEVVRERLGVKSGTTVTRRYSQAHIDRLRDLI